MGETLIRLSLTDEGPADAGPFFFAQSPRFKTAA